MAALSCNLLALLFLSILFGAGWCQQCGLSNIKVTQTGTGNVVQGKSEFQVVVTNDCICSQQDVRFRAAGFQSAEAIDPKIFRQDGGNFLLNDGQPLHSSETVTFNYAWDNQFSIVPVDSQIACS
ncbi:hypothetical protein H6P81_020110 [Aristolochia fimbriata]|uniref:Uncharacterized protein n=1 Tax=Aristolochia fimbriata TaxID=158543 RepID=A0AAV7DVE5_ARIFI|nr:hypothetical protein H6P81_020110 [Aristolochia fimbriata]